MRYKVGDKVRIKSLDWYKQGKEKYCRSGDIYLNGTWFYFHMSNKCGCIMTVKSINNGYYRLEDSNDNWTDEMIEGLVEEKDFRAVVDEHYFEMLGGESTKEFNLPDGFEFRDENDNVINAKKIVLEKKKPKYPKTYEECCTILGFHYDHYLTYDDEKNLPVSRDESDFIDSIDVFAKLIICRNAYWKIAGKEMGLGKPWEPDWGNDNQFKYIIICRRDNVIKDTYTAKNCILAFPTEEMRDAFYEAFKEDIERCKELL